MEKIHKNTANLLVRRIRLSKKSGKVWAFSAFCGKIFIGDEDVRKEQATKNANRNAVYRRLRTKGAPT